ncbi:uncharacterized protein LOC105189804 isoform X2 [Harpegnathos saltator]|uniref:uncharacterized protein LOC105189804 isoform X2 n=1 Tax=Harpegnathos saltator TaxID=610380 RepID=UPI000DBEF1F5|nr:uncharacterized protein LOC105189804 isoform X2 [Harpegnathos saltator]
MEVDSITEMFLRSDEKFGVKYTNYIGDGDSKTFAGILKINPYGDDCPVTKNECVGHVQKRMGSRLRNIKQKRKLGGKKRLTDGVIKKLTIYYILTIRRNVDSVQKMKEAIIATLDHYCSTDESPRHDNCPVGIDSWCEWRKAKSINQLKSFKHPDRLINEEVEKHIRPIYEDLSNDNLLMRCLGGYIQNSNESFNSTIWLITPKHLNSGQKIVEIAAYMAAGQQCKMFADIADTQRIERENKRQAFSSKEARIARRLDQMHHNEVFEEVERLLYGPRIAD